MKKILLLLSLFFIIDGFSQPILVDTNTYTTSQLVRDILINKNCVTIDNIKSSTGTNFGSANGIGYFINNNKNFPIKNGVILSTGNVINAVGPNKLLLSDGTDAWGGDADLEAALRNAGITMASKNATVLEFDFVPLSEYFDFNFVFASEEYGKFQCQFSDAFAFLLTNLSTGVTTNLAVVPNTTDPISVVTIRQSTYNSQCSDENPTFFDRSNEEPNDLDAAINFNGQTVRMNASYSSLVPNTKYRIKLVIADRKDFQSDSAIFLEASSFNVGDQVLGNDLTVASGTAVCPGGTKKLESGLDPAAYTFAWTFNGVATGGNTPDLTVTRAGTYGLKYAIKATNCLVTEDFIKVEYFSPITTPNPADLYLCNSSLINLDYNLALNTPSVQVAGTQISYHLLESEANLDINNNPLPNIYSVPVTSLPLRIWIRIVNITTKCYITKSFLLRSTPPPTVPKPSNYSLCETSTGSKIAKFILSSQTGSILSGQTAGLYGVFYHLSQSDALARTRVLPPAVAITTTGQQIFARIQSTTDPNCFTITSFDLVVTPRPVLDIVSDLFVCTPYALPALANAGTYYSGPNKGLPVLPVGHLVTSDQTIYIYNEVGTLACASQAVFSVKFITQIDLSIGAVTRCDNYVLPRNLNGIRYFTLPNGPLEPGNVEIPGGRTIITSGTYYTYFESSAAASPCKLGGQIDLTIFETPKITEAPFKDIFACGTYSLKPLLVGNYYTHDNTTNTYTPIMGDITITTKVHVFAENNSCKTPIYNFTVYINNLSVSNVNECRFYDLLAAPLGEYRDAPNGGGNIILPGRITKTTTVYTNIPGALCNIDPFIITIGAPFITAPPTNFKSCGPYILTQNTDGAKYYKFSGGPSRPGGNVELIPNIYYVTSTQTIYLFKQGTIVGCDNELPWTITYSQSPTIDARGSQSACDSYILTPLINGSYFAESGGKSPISAGTVINKTSIIYIYAVSPTDPTCFTENSFDILINGVEADPVPTQLTYCESFTFPVLPTPNNFYYDAPNGQNGTGTIIPAGTVVTAANLKPEYYVYRNNGERAECYSDKPFKITLKPEPIANTLNPIVICDTFGDKTDGVFEFDLTASAIRNQVVNGQAFDAELNLSFYRSEAEANDFLNGVAIANPAKYQNRTVFSNAAYRDSVWIRVNNNTIVSGCFAVTKLDLIVYPELPVDPIPAQLTHCVSFTFPPLPSPNNFYYNATGGPTGTGQVIPAGTTVTATTVAPQYYISRNDGLPLACFQERPFKIIIKPEPIANTVNAIVTCDTFGDKTDGVIEFDLTASAIRNQVVNGQAFGAELSLSFYSSEAEANDFLNGVAIANPARYQNRTVFSNAAYRDSVWIRVYNNTVVSGCFAVTKLDLIVFPELPVDPIPTQLTHCVSFTFPPLPSPNNFYYNATGGPAGTGQVIPAGTTVTATTVAPQYYISRNDGLPLACFQERPFKIIIKPEPVANTVNAIVTCDTFGDKTDGVIEFDLTASGIRNQLVNGQAFGAELSLSFYSSEAEANDFLNGVAIANPARYQNRTVFSNAAYRDSVWIRVHNNTVVSGCFDVTKLDLIVFPELPVDPIPTQLTHCVSFTFPPLPSPNNFYYNATGGPNGTGTKINAGTTILARAPYTPENYFISRDDGLPLQCFQEKSFTITVKPNPVANTVSTIETCDTFRANDGVFEFNLTNPAIRNQIVNGQPLDAELDVSFYNTQAEARDYLGGIPITNLSRYQNKIPVFDSVWIRINNRTVLNGCFDVTELKLIVNPFPEPVLDSNYYLCEDYETKSVHYPIKLDTGLTNINYDFVWTHNGVSYPKNEGAIVIEEEGKYEVVVTNKLTGCVAPVIATQVIKYKPYLNISYSDAFVFPTFITITVLGDSSSNFEYSIDNRPFQASNIFNNVSPGEHILAARDLDGHCDPMPLKKTIINFPNFFTPNGDGYNETWNVSHLKETNPFTPINIYDRYGKLLKQINPSSEGWNGTFNGRALPSSDYWFSLEYKEKGNVKLLKSHFTLKR